LTRSGGFSENGNLLSSMIELTPRNSSGPVARNIKIIGIGGAGANALDRMALDGVPPERLIAVDTEAQALVSSVAGEKIQLGLESTRGLGSGGDPEMGRCAAEESAGEIRSALEGAETVFVLAGLGGGTGSGAAPFVAELAREAGALVIAIVTLPFSFEGKRRAAQAQEALAALAPHADAIVCFENDRMGDAVPPKAGIQSAFAAADQTLSQSVLALAALINRNGLIPLGFSELTAVLRDSNARCIFGYGEAQGDNRSFDALALALKNPLMDKGRLLRDCETVLVQVSGGPDLTLDEVQLLMEEFNRFVNDRTRILFGAAVEPELAGRLAVTILSSVGEVRSAAVRPRPAAVEQRPAPVVAAPRPAPVAVAPVPAPAPVVAESRVELEPEFEPEPEEEGFSLVVQAEGEGQDEAFAGEEEEPVVAEEPPVAPRIEKPRGLRAATQQASLFGEEPAAPVEKIAPPVPGRMLRRPFPERPAPVSEPVVEVVPELVVELEPVSEPISEPPVAEEPEPEPVQEPAIIEAKPRPAFARRPAPAPQPRSPELIPQVENAAPAGAKAPQQEILQFEPVTRGRFEKSEPTIVDGQDLDVPTYMRRRVKLR